MTRYEMMCAVIISAISVANAETEVMKIEMNDGSMQIVDIAKIKEITFDVKNDDGGDLQGHEAVDLGLSVKWATCNVGATTPADFGGYYAWGETEEKEAYTRENYIDPNPNHVDMNLCGTDKDVAHVKWGGSWRMPTYSELNELVDHCDWRWTNIDGVNGYQVTGPNGNSIFMPASGRKCDDPGYGGLSYCNDNGYYRIGDHIGKYTYFINFSSGDVDIDRDYDYRTLGFSVRAVTD